MNHAYRLTWNEAAEAWVAAPETARTRCRSGRVRAVSAAVLSALTCCAHALPTGDSVSAGAGTVATAGSTMTVTQTSQNLALNWQSYNIGANETVNYVQPNASAIALNRVLGADGTQILGRLNANGQVWILNPNGVLFGKTAQVNVGGLAASTLGLSDADFLAGKRTFSGSGGNVTNQGEINANYVALLGEQVKNEGVIVATRGTVALAAGNKVTLDFAGDRLLNVQIEEGALKALADNKNLIEADGGLVVMTARAKDALLDTAVNNSGVIRARTLENRAGRILLLGDMQSGTVNAGGTIDASAPTTGDGGFIETSAAHVKVADGTKITTKAANGKSGTWLIDPVDFTIAAGSGALTTSGIGATTLSNSLSLSNVAIATDAGTGGNGDIFVNSAVSWSANKLTLTAHRNIEINANLNASGTASLALEYGQGAVALGNTSNYYLGNGAKVHLPAGNNFSTKLGSNGATTTWTVITSLGAAGSVTGTDLQGMNGNLAGKYVLGADIDASTTSGWNGGNGFKPVGGDVILPAASPEFIGSFDGLGHTITGLTIKNPWTDYRGLFGYASSTAILRNVGLINTTVEGRNGVGTLLGGSFGGVSPTISYSYADGGSVLAHGVGSGGLVGGGSGVNISYSYANVSVIADGSAGSSAVVGGLAGAADTVSNSYATGSVQGGDSVGGLLGQANGAITNSYATGAVSASGANFGGLVGQANGGSSASNSYWNKQTTGQNGSALGTGIDTTAQMQTLFTFNTWSIANSGGSSAVWRIYEGQTNPLLRNFLTPLTVTANNATTIYNGTAYSGGNGVTGSISGAVATLSGSPAYGGTAQGATNVGSYTLTVNGYWSGQRGYDISYANGTLTVNKAPLTVTASNATKTVDGLAWSGGNGLSYAGFAGGEGASVLGGTPAWGGTSQGAVNVGSYVLTPSGLTSGNYAISFVSGTLTIANAVPSVPGAPTGGYSGAIVSLFSGTANNAAVGGLGGKAASNGPALLASAEGGAAPALPGVPGFSIQLCGQALPSKAAKDCQ